MYVCLIIILAEKCLLSVISSMSYVVGKLLYNYACNHCYTVKLYMQHRETEN